MAFILLLGPRFDSRRFSNIKNIPICAPPRFCHAEFFYEKAAIKKCRVFWGSQKALGRENTIFRFKSKPSNLQCFGMT